MIDVDAGSSGHLTFCKSFGTPIVTILSADHVEDLLVFAAQPDIPCAIKLWCCSLSRPAYALLKSRT